MEERGDVMIYDTILKLKRLIKIFFCKHHYEYIVVKDLMGFEKFHYYKCTKCNRQRDEMP